MRRVLLLGGLGLVMACQVRLDVFEPVDGGPAEPATLRGASLVSAGETHACAVAEGRIACWGDNRLGQCGRPPSPWEPPGWATTATDEWVDVVTGLQSTCARTRAGVVSCWGSNQLGQLGLGQSDLLPHEAPSVVPLPASAAGLSGQFGTLCAWLVDGRSACWGQNSEGQLGLDEWPPDPDTARPRELRRDGGWAQVDVGQGHVCGVGVDSSLWCWGRNTERQLGLGEPTPGQLRAPQRVGLETNWQQVAVAQENTCALKRDGSLWCFGAFGEAAGRVDSQPRLRGQGFTSLSAHTFHRCGLQGDRLLCFGSNQEGQLALGDTVARLEPTPAEGTWRAISTGRFFTCGVRTDTSVWCVGDQRTGELGAGPPSPERSLAWRAVLAPLE